MKYTTSLVLFACLIPNTTHTSLLKFRRKKGPEQKIITLFEQTKSGNKNTQKAIQKVEKLLQEHPHLAQLKTKDGWTLAHYAAASLHPDLLQLVVDYNVDFLQQNSRGRLPIELLGQTFMKKILEANKVEQSIKNSLGKAASLNRERSQAQNNFYRSMGIITNKGTKGIEDNYQAALDLCEAITKVILAMVPPQHIHLSTLWREDNTDNGITFLQACPLPPEYFQEHGYNLPDHKWYEQIVQ